MSFLVKCVSCRPTIWALAEAKDRKASTHLGGLFKPWTLRVRIFNGGHNGKQKEGRLYIFSHEWDRTPPPPEEETGDERKVGLEMELKMR